ncbi:MAG: 30S ribosome-binding factor RbfA [Elusimicrobiota bacterium]
MFERRERLQELFHKEIALAVKMVKDPGLAGFLTITGVSLSADQKTAEVYYSVLGNLAQRKSAAQALNRAAPYLRQVIKRRVSLKLIPHFVFIYDETPSRASRIDKIIMNLERPKDTP